MKKTEAEVIQLIEHQLTQAQPMQSLFQTLSEHFYPERADFIVTRNVGQELADSLVDSYPTLVRRDLANSFSAMLRDGHWFNVATDGEPDHMGNQWLQWSTMRLMKLMSDRKSNFIRATKEGDHDFATFGQTVISAEPSRQRNGILYRAWHLRDCAWWEDETGQVCGVVRKWKPTIRQLVDYFGEDPVHTNIVKELHDHPFKQTDIRHVVMPANVYGDDELEEKYPYVSIFVDVANEHFIEVTGLNHKMYIVPRFQTIAGSAYAYSPATVVGLPDARCLQAMTHTILEAGERYARPPMIATQKVIRSDVDLSPDGITWVDEEYDEKMGAALRPLQQDRGGFPIGLELRQNIVETLSSAFYLDKLSLPDKSNMTAYEVSEHMKQYRRQNLPLFAPMESEYNGQLCEISFQIARDGGFLGSPQDIPESLLESDVRFKFESPLSESEEEEKATRFQQMAGLLAEAAAHDPNVVMNVNFDASFRDAVEGIKAPAKWLKSLEEVTQGRQLAMAKDAAAMMAETGMTMQ